MLPVNLIEFYENVLSKIILITLFVLNLLSMLLPWYEWSGIRSLNGIRIYLISIRKVEVSFLSFAAKGSFSFTTKAAKGE